MTRMSTEPVGLPGAPTQGYHAATKAYADGAGAGPSSLSIDAYGADPTGAADSATAFNAALAALPTTTIGGTTYAQGTIRLGKGAYAFNGATATNNIGPLVSVVGPGKGACTVKYTGTGGRWLYMHDTKIPTKFVNLSTWGSVIDGFTLDGTDSSGALGIDYGDTEGGVIGPDLLIKNFTGTGAVGLYISNRYWWTENLRINLSIFNCSTCLMFDGTRGPGGNSYNSFEYMAVDVKVYMFPSQDGVTLDHGAFFGNGSLTIRANCATSTAANTGAVIRLQGQSASGHLNTDEYSYISTSRLEIQAETNSSTEFGSANGPQTIAFGDVNQNRIVNTVGPWAFLGVGGWQPFTATGWAKETVKHLGPIYGETVLAPGTATTFDLTHIGTLMRPLGYTTTGGQMRDGTGDFHQVTLSADSTISVANSRPGPHEKVIMVTQAASGGPWKITWQTNVSPTISAPTIVWSNGIAPQVTQTAGGTDLFRLVTLDGITWYGHVIRTRDGVLTTEKAVGARLYAPSGQSLPSGSTTALTGMTQHFNDDSTLYTVNASAGTITVLRAGVYMHSWTCRTSGGSSGKRFSYVQQNTFNKRQAAAGWVSGIDTISNGAFPIRLAANDVVTMAAFVDGGTAAAVVGNQNYDTGFELLYLGA